MTIQNTQRGARFGLLPTVVLTLALSASFASVGRTDEATQVQSNAGLRANQSQLEELRESFQATAQEAASQTKIKVATSLSLRLDRQHRPYRLASENSGRRG